MKNHAPVMAFALTLMTAACSSEGSGLLASGKGEDKSKVDASSAAAEAKESGTDVEGETDETASEPIWVNAVPLTMSCDWGEVLDEKRAAIDCRLPSDGREAAGGAKFEWSIKDQNGAAIAARTTSAAPLQRFEQDALRFYDAKVSARMFEGDHEKTFEVALKDGLRGFKDGGGMDECLRGNGSTVVACMQQEGVEVKAPAAAPAASPAAGTGRAVGGFNWHLGGAGESCDEVCAPHSGVTEGAITYAGSALERCEAVVNAFGFNGTQGQVLETQPCDPGCYLSYGANPWWFGGATVTQSCRGSKVMARFCSCAR